MNLVLKPKGGGRFQAYLFAQPVGPPTRQPLFDSTRLLLQRGIPAETELTTSHIGSSTIAMRSTVGEAAKWTIEETRSGLRKRLWKPFDKDSIK